MFWAEEKKKRGRMVVLFGASAPPRKVEHWQRGKKEKEKGSLREHFVIGRLGEGGKEEEGDRLDLVLLLFLDPCARGPMFDPRERKEEGKGKKGGEAAVL